MNSLSIFYFDFHQVRSVGTWEKPEWVASDVIAILYPEAQRSSYSKYLEKVKPKWKAKKTILTPGGRQEMTTLLEPGLYYLINRSNSALAEPFQEWFYEKVIPSIRMTGNYSFPVIQEPTSQPMVEPVQEVSSELILKPFQEPVPPREPHRFVERAEISEQQLRVFCFLKDLPERWLTSKEIAEGAGVNPRTTRFFCRYFQDAGVFDMIEVFPGHRYRFSEMAMKCNSNIYKRLLVAVEAMGNPLTRQQMRLG